MTNEELYSLASSHYIMVYLDVDCEIRPTLVNFGELELCDHIKGPTLNSPVSPNPAHVRV